MRRRRESASGPTFSVPLLLALLPALLFALLRLCSRHC